MSSTNTLAGADRPGADRSSRLLPALDRVALGAVLLLPLLLMQAHGIADGAIGVADLCFLARSAIARDWAWLRTPWLRIGLAWWGWVVVCSLPVPALGLGSGGLPSLVQAVVTLRFLLLVAALEHAVLRPAAPRRWLYWIAVASTLYIGIQSAVQFVFGRNLYGFPSSGGEVLTGPFHKPRAGPPLSRIVLPAVLPPAAALLSRGGIGRTLGAFALVLVSVCIMVVIGQRMPLLLTGLGFVIAALLLRRLRAAVLVAGVAGLLLIAASPIVAPAVYHRQVQKFSHQMDDFASSPYGELYTRALEIAVQHPIAGVGGDGFRFACPQPRYFRPTLDGRVPDDGGAAICASHPHNFYAEALVNGGIVGLALFSALSVAWVLPVGRGLWRDPDPLRVGLFASIVIQLWPIASTSAFVSMPMGGWFFLILGWGMAEARWPRGVPS
ncbi:MAG TPA: O-antigen ligase family protein [Acetobacteraceae bacterium]|jgi:O-antigen ligase